MCACVKGTQLNVQPLFCLEKSLTYPRLRRLHDVVPRDAALSTPPVRVEVKVQWSEVLLQSPRPGGSRSARSGRFHSWLRRMFRAAEIVFCAV